MELRPGYKQTEVGAIPEDWDVVLLDSVSRRASGHTPDKAHPEYWGGDIKWVSLADSHRLDDLYIDETTATITAKGIANSSANILPAGCCVVSRDAGVGKSAVLAEKMAVSQHFMAWYCGPSLNNHYLYFLLQAMKPELERIAIGNTIKTIGLPYFKSLRVPLPSVVEQQSIASALLDVDQLTRELAACIAKKRNIKQAAMQELLTGKRRLPGFQGEWAEVSLGSVAAMNSGGTPPTGRDDFYGGGIQWVSISDMTSSGRFISETERTLSDLGLANCAAKRFPAGTILYAIYASLGECSMAAREVTTSQAILGIRPGPSLVGEYLYYWLESIRGAVKLMGQQGTQSNLNKKIVQGFSLGLPSKPEQAAIAKALGEIDQDIDALKDKAEKTRAMKVGMMQQLLTGKIRLR
ncbi:MAG: restriction endonuclease subunit S [Cyanobacteriota bacterium]|jgi:type I restriction enzyme S subunit